MLLAATVGTETGAGAQSSDVVAPPENTVVYRREVFRYPRAGRPDPFRSLLGAMDAGVRPENLVLRGIVYSPDPSSSFAVVTEAGGSRALRLRAGQRIGSIQVVAIHPRSVDLLIQELGGARRESLVLPKAGQKGNP